MSLSDTLTDATNWTQEQIDPIPLWIALPSIPLALGAIALAVGGVSYFLAPKWTQKKLLSAAATGIGITAGAAEHIAASHGLTPGITPVEHKAIDPRITLSSSGPGVGLTSGYLPRLMGTAHFTGAGLAGRFTSTELANTLKRYGATDIAKNVRKFAPSQLYAGVDILSILQPFTLGVDIGPGEASDAAFKLRKLQRAVNKAYKNVDNSVD